MKLFCYGTLQKAFHNHYLLAGAKFLREDAVQGTLYTSSPQGRGIPFLLPGVGTIQGELYDVPDELTHRLDVLEGHPTWYTREHRRLLSGEAAQVYVYNHPEQVERLYLAPSGRYDPRTTSPTASPKSDYSASSEAL